MIWGAHASRVLAMASRYREFLFRLLRATTRLDLATVAEKFVSAGRRDQHARRARYPASKAPNWIPWASGNSVEKLIVFVCRRM